MVDRRQRVGNSRRYPRTSRINEVLREVIAEELERLEDVDARLGLLTVTHVEAEPDLRHATVLLASLSDEVAEALAEHRVRIQGAIARQVRLKRTPRLAFEADPAIATGARVEDILRGLTKADGGAEIDQSSKGDAAD
ncbi:MAG: 30S ribosome-binding factor RbfA [Actinomycetota bacterium]|nr:30S ribosome-binding factor RbfA [Actinomycetota bacterium]